MYKMLVESEDWNELQKSLVETNKRVEEYRKVLQDLCKEYQHLVKDAGPVFASVQKYL